jgi:hypothetical protein
LRDLRENQAARLIEQRIDERQLLPIVDQEGPHVAAGFVS